MDKYIIIFSFIKRKQNLKPYEKSYKAKSETY